jgi:hypothetical protein
MPTNGSVSGRVGSIAMARRKAATASSPVVRASGIVDIPQVNNVDIAIPGSVAALGLTA